MTIKLFSWNGLQLGFLLSLTAMHAAHAFVTPRTAAHVSSFDLGVLQAQRSNNEERQTIESIQEEQTRQQIIKTLMYLRNDQNLQEAFLAGQAQLPVPSSSQKKTDSFRSCAVLTPTPITNIEEDKTPALLLPLTSPAQLKLLSFAKANRPLSKSVLLGLNMLLVNRDGALFDNLPWAQWSVDPQKRNYDAAGNPIEVKNHLGKRDAYNRFMGKDWQGRSASIGNMALRVKYMIEEDANIDNKEDTKEESTVEENIPEEEEESNVSLAQRILELQIKELEMDLAEWDYQLAVARNEQPEIVTKLQMERQECEDQLVGRRSDLRALSEEQRYDEETPEEYKSLVSKILDNVADWSTDYGKNAAPYRGAIGYAPMLDTEQDIDESRLPYTSPYDLLKEILDDQLNAEVIGAVLENTSLLDGTLALGGALVLRRKVAKKTINLAGEEVDINDEDEDFGNTGGQGGATMLVECDADEAIAMALTCSVPIQMESGMLDRASVMVAPVETEARPETSVRGALPLWKPIDSELSVLTEGQASEEAPTERTSPISIPRTTSSLFDSIFEPAPDGAPTGMFPTDNPVQSLAQYDEFSNRDKAKTLLEMSNFDGKLPRPRVLRKDEATRGGVNSLDDLLLPLIDESVRRQYLMRDAEMRGDTETLEQLRSEKTKRQLAKEKADEARASGDDDAAAFWESEADFYGNLRADVTQDEGSYSRFLDRDDWYERTRQAQAKKIDKNKFGTLLDGIE